jgi:prepilin-type N-terminal cleavage/methylation domain-containing protein
MKSRFTNPASTRASKLKRSVIRSHGAMTLIEVIVAMAIVSIIAVMCVSSFMVILGSEMRETNTRVASERAESMIASGFNATSSSDVTLTLGGYPLPTTKADSYAVTVGAGDVINTSQPDGSTGSIDISGSRSYTVLQDVVSSQTPLPIFFGDFGGAADTFLTKGEVFDTGTAGGMMTVKITVAGRYSIEVWGARGGGVNGGYESQAGGGRGGYAAGEVTLNKNDTLYLYAGGKGIEFKAPGDCSSQSGGSNGGGMIYTNSGGGTTGGGASYVRINGETLYSRVIVAGGGGGVGQDSVKKPDVGVRSGGNGGGAAGADSALSPNYDQTFTRAAIYVRGGGGTQTAGGTFKGGEFNLSIATVGGIQQLATVGSFGAGGQGVGYGYGGGGGGGGWYGGAGGCINAGGGGSGWVYTQAAYESWKSVVGATEADKYTLTSGYYLTNTKLEAGDYYSRPGKTPLPDPLDPGFDPNDISKSGRTMFGNSRGGFVRIVYLGA